jgi:putative transposase
MEPASAPVMSKLHRTKTTDVTPTHARTFFVTTKTAQCRSLFQTDRMANLFIDVLRQNMRDKHFTVHEFVVMPDHVHVLLTVPANSTVEKSVQRIKGGFSFRAGRGLDFKGEIWQKGFSEVRIFDGASFAQHKIYIENNPVKRGLVSAPENYPFGSTFLKLLKRNEASAGAKAQVSSEAACGPTEVGP